MNVINSISVLELRSIWPDEARDFTPWLSSEEGLKQLSEKIGIDLELIETESRVGGFSADILAKTQSGEFVVIENQYAKSNHDHLGKTLTYLVGSEAKITIWIVEEAREEHSRVFEWLNDNTPEAIGFFLLTIKAIKIGDSQVAPLFEIVVQPNKWAKQQKMCVSERNETEIGKQRNQFFEELKAFDIATNANAALKWRKFGGDHWTDLAIGSSDAHISITLVPRSKHIGVELYISNQLLYEYLEMHRLEIDEKISGLIWMPLEDKKTSRIKKEIAGDFRSFVKKEVVFAEIIATVQSFFDAFQKRVKSFKG